MKLTMRATATLGKKVTLITAAFVLAVSTLTAAVPFILSQKASAIEGPQSVTMTHFSTYNEEASKGLYAEFSFTGFEDAVDATITIKRASGGDVHKSLKANRVQAVINESTSNATSTPFFINAAQGGRYEGLSTSWSAMRTDDGGVPVWNKATQPLFAYATITNEDGSKVQSANLNFSETHNSQTVSYLRVIPAEAPTNLRFVNDDNSAVIANGAAVKDSKVTLVWDTAPYNADRYQVRVTAPSGASQSNRQTGWYTFDLNDATRYGFFGTEQGTWTYEVRTKDAISGVWSKWTAPVSLAYDTTGPTYTITNIVNNQRVGTASTGKLNIQGSFNDAISGANYIQLQLVKGGDRGVITKHGSVTNGSLGSFDVAGFEKGWYQLNVLGAADMLGNWAPVNQSISFYLDPAAPMVSLNAVPSFVKGTITVTGSVADDSQLNHYNLSLYPGTTVLTNAEPQSNKRIATSDGVWVKDGTVYGIGSPTNISRNLNTKLIDDGAYQVRLAAKDSAEQSSFQITGFVVDNTKPVVNTPALGTVNGMYTFAITQTEENPEKTYVEYMEKDTNGIFRKKSGQWFFNTNDLSYTVDTANFADGVHQVKVSSTDKAGNTNGATFEVDIDNTDPTATVMYSPSAITNGPVVATLTANEPIQTPAGWVSVNGSETVFTKEYTANVTNESVLLVDGVGNEGQSQVTINWIDTIDPEILSVITNGATVRGTAIFSIDEATKLVTVNGTAITSSGTAGKGPYQVTGDGTYTVVATDLAGNVSDAFTFTINNAQTITLNPIDLQSATPLITGTALWAVDPAAVDSMTVTIDGNPYAAAIDADGNWSVQVISPLENGAHTLVVNGTSFAFTTSIPAALLTPAITNPAAALGASDAANNGEQVEGASSENKAAQAAADANKGVAMGLAWYWWLLILAGIALILWWIIAAIRRRQSQDA